ncbi:hypothetical protein BDP27DRAFT_1334505 [Rhodocollybia butyracea]|uniref:ubiquitinyl hydrolase 1 n=1 Tax=Rhodocollybia butyracea TaxID=206335 RepID=A0A9P5PDU9_9AGAR|nr:hypothetical protein BDP27DRAFT_1334505 [Rhodocollybia butyracea]
MANPYMPSSYYDQSGPAPYAYDNQAGPSSYPYQYGVNGHAYQNYHPQQQHYFPQNPIPNGKSPQSQNFSHTPEYNYHHPYPVPPPNSHSSTPPASPDVATAPLPEVPAEPMDDELVQEVERIELVSVPSVSVEEATTLPGSPASMPALRMMCPQSQSQWRYLMSFHATSCIAKLGFRNCIYKGIRRPDQSSGTDQHWKHVFRQLGLATPYLLNAILSMRQSSSWKTFYQKRRKRGWRLRRKKAKASSSNGSSKERSSTPHSDEDYLSPFIPTGIYDALKTKKQFDSMRGGQQKMRRSSSEELTTLTETLSKAASGPTKTKKKETEEDAPPEAEQDGWLEVGKRNRTVVTRTIKSTDSPITRIFGGKFRSSLRAIVEDWRSLQLDIQGSQQVLLEALPPVLVLHMKRFEYDAAVGGVVKVGKQVTFGPELVVGTDVLSAKGRSTLGPGTIYHHGISASGGHYTLDVLHPDRYPRAATAKPREGWIRIDDELVSDVRPEDVFGPGEFDDGGVRCAYLLFYCRTK